MFTGLASFFTAGGIFMWFILLVLAAALAVIIERIIFFRHTCRHDAGNLVAEIARAVNAGDPDRALARLAGGTSPLQAILATALERFRAGLTFDLIRQGMEETAIREVPRLSKRLNYLAMFANIATLTGLLGTIFGLQESFSSLAATEAAQKAAMLAGGISQAMNTTAFGLLVAIPCMIAYSVLSNMQARIAADLDASSVKIMNFLQTKRQSEC